MIDFRVCEPEPPPEFVGAFSHRDCVELATTDNHPRNHSVIFELWFGFGFGFSVRFPVQFLILCPCLFLTIENLVHARPPSCSSRRDGAIDTDHAAIRVHTKPLEPPEVSPLRARETHVPSLSARAATHSGHAPPSPTAIRRSRRARPPFVRCREPAAALPPPRRRR
ncbi:hypothetical protein DY000_02015879 [Brassica cretica]|uniref:Uncharacterized protein n=1 Tax=Brassica cretica TaxID=69181 RepID=A0ABQ7DBA2_BRACR|nr:hypothetical protein DY000_02015879 [Brassica cretica]